MGFADLSLDGSMALPLPGTGAWKSYTPTISGWTQGNGTPNGAYTQIGKVVFFWCNFSVGSTTVFGSLDMGLPVTANASAVGRQLQGTLLDTSAGVRYFSIGRIASTTTFTAFCMVAGSAGQYALLTSTTPFTWEVSDIPAFYGFYEAA